MAAQIDPPKPSGAAATSGSGWSQWMKENKQAVAIGAGVAVVAVGVAYWLVKRRAEEQLKPSGPYTTVPLTAQPKLSESEVEALEKEAYDKVAQGEHGAAAVLLDRLAAHYGFQKNYTKCLEYMKHELAEIEQDRGTRESDVYVRVLVQVGIAYTQLKDIAAAAETFETVVQIEDAMGVPIHSGYQPLANMYSELKRYSEAEELYRKFLSECESVDGKEPYEVVTALDGLAVAFVYQDKDLEEAEKLFERSLAIKESYKGKMSVEYAEALSNLGGVRHKLGKSEDALAALEESTDILEGLHGDKHPHLQTNLNNMAAVAMYMSDLEAAVGYLTRLREVLKNSPKYGLESDGYRTISDAIARLIKQMNE